MPFLMHYLLLNTDLKKTISFVIFDTMNLTISHDRNNETIEAKVRWFRSLSLSERMDLLCDFTDLVLELNPQLPEKKNAQQTAERIQILSAA